MPKIESIRPGGTLESSFDRYPLPEILIGVLRGNLSGKLDIALHPEPRNQVFFKDGVPVLIRLPDTGISLNKVLAEQGVISTKVAQELLNAVESSGRSEAALILERGVLSKARLQKALHSLARAQLVALFDAGPVEFRFVEGEELPEGDVTILETLPTVYEGLLKARDAAMLERLAGREAVERAFVVAETFPRGVDPFRWGSKALQVIESLTEPVTVADLVSRGLELRCARAVFLSLRMADMLELRFIKSTVAEESRSEARPESRPESRPEPRLEPRSGDAPGLKIQYRSTGVNAPPRPQSPHSPLVTPASAEQESEQERVNQRMSSFEGMSYFQVLRVTPGTDPKQLERAYRFMVRQLDESAQDASSIAQRGLIDEAYACLSDPEQEQRYRSLHERAELSSVARRDLGVLEAEPKVDRALRAIGDSRFAEANYLLRWAGRLDPVRGDVPIFLELNRLGQRSPDADLPKLRAMAFTESKRKPEDRRLKLCMAMLFAHEREFKTAKGVLDEAMMPEHPLSRHIKGLIRAG